MATAPVPEPSLACSMVHTMEPVSAPTWFVNTRSPSASRTSVQALVALAVAAADMGFNSDVCFAACPWLPNMVASLFLRGLFGRRRRGGRGRDNRLLHPLRLVRGDHLQREDLREGDGIPHPHDLLLMVDERAKNFDFDLLHDSLLGCGAADKRCGVLYCQRRHNFFS